MNFLTPMTGIENKYFLSTVCVFLNSFSMLSPSFHYIKPLLDIPAHAQKKLFPDASISVLDFLKFSLPIISRATSHQKALTFFSTDDPNVHDITEIQNIPIPPTGIVAGLVEACTTAFLLGNKSIKCSHLPSGSGQNLPVWIITYWAEVLELRTTSRKAWVKAEEFLRQWKKVWKKPSSGKTMDHIMQEAYDVLSYLPWSGNIYGFDDREPIHTLATYASHKWFSTLHENQMLDLLRWDLLLQNYKIEIENMAFFPKLQEAYDHQDIGEYDESHKFARIQSIAHALEAGERRAWYHGEY